MFFDLDEAPLNAQQSAKIIDAVRPFLSAVKDRADFEQRIKQASQPDSGMVQFGNHDCYGSEKVGCSMGDVSERFISEKYFPMLVDLVCGEDSEDFVVAAKKGVLRQLVVEEIEWGNVEWLDTFIKYNLKILRPIVYLAPRLLEALDAKRCPAVESMPEDIKKRLRKAAAYAEQFRLLELRVLPDP